MRSVITDLGSTTNSGKKEGKMCLTLSLPPCHLKMTNKIAKFEIIKPYFLSHERISLKRHSVKSKLVPESYARQPNPPSSVGMVTGGGISSARMG